MKKYLSVVLGIIFTACLVACGSSDKDSVSDNHQDVISNQAVLNAVVYFSGTGNTREVVDLLAVCK